MNDMAIRVENISKLYKIGAAKKTTLVESFRHSINKIIGKADDFGNVEDFWALKDVSFEIKKGEAVGIIGKNGAGKSTLLKILSRITEPSSGKIEINGRVASLLEVGTGFHPELTGRENIYLNGTILGMKRAEIRSKFEEIVEFSGIQKFIDTPVKRYSSGMYVRLAFAVAAHLEPEILIIDEVLAVGDAEFQKKCLGKMEDVTGQGRTVLFVSHNMSAVNSFCKSCVYLRNGKVHSIGGSDKVIQQYLTNENAPVGEVRWEADKRPGDDVAVLHAARLIDENHKIVDFTYLHHMIGIEYEFEILKAGHQPVPNIHVFSAKGECAFVSAEDGKRGNMNPGMYKSVMWIPANLLNEGTYIIGIALSTMDPVRAHFFAQEALYFEAIEDINLRQIDYKQAMPGILRPQMSWETTRVKSLVS
jgi:lipopolysaccharide transport system ATP-binding protein